LPLIYLDPTLNAITTIDMAKKKSKKPAQTGTVIQDLVIKPIRRNVWEASAWRSALRSADYGRPSTLYDMYDDMLLDPYLSHGVDKRTNAVALADLVFADSKGKPVEVMDDLMDTIAWEDLLKEIAKSRFYGRSAAELSFNDDGLVTSAIPTKHISLERKGIIIDLANEEKVIPYEGERSLIVCGKPRYWGLILKGIPYAIFKRGGFGDWAQWIELFGMPMRIGKYNSYDQASRRVLEQALEQAGSAAYMVVPDGAEIDIRETKATNGISFDQFRKACNEEILISLLGQTLTTIAGDKGARSLGEVHMEVEESLFKSDQKYVQRILNSQVLPFLEERGLPVSGGRFVFPSSVEQTSVNDLVQLSTLMAIPESYLRDRYGIPAPDGDEPTTGKKEEPKQEEEKPEEEEPKEPKKEEQPDKKLHDVTLAASKKKAQKVRTPWWLKLKHSITGNIQLADDYSINIDKLFEEALKEVYGEALVEESKKTLSPSLFRVTNDPLQHAVDSAFASPEFGKPEQGFLDQFKYNTGVFAAFKAHAEQKLLVSMLLDEEGNLRSFREFRKAVKAVNIQWNEQWLRTEYNTAVRSARSAANYQDALRSKDTYPNLEYLISSARDKRDEHLELVGTILPIEDPFWDIYLPPWDWNCQCSFRPTDKPATGVPKITQMIPPTFQNNPGKTAEFVKLNEHPYLKGKGVATCPECRRQGLVSSGSGDELCQMHQQAREEHVQKLDSKETTKRLLAVLRPKEVRYPEFKGKLGKFVRNSVTENMRYGELYPIKKEVLENIDEYLNAEYMHKFKKNVKRSKDNYVLGYHKFTIKYKGNNPIGKDRNIELQFEERETGEIVFHFIKLI
ncbi:DUF935 family protein, partial [Porphyromonadaceae bacterium W3.11]|nr:DUF935 family protein [Porphyromonadaceae bacterium W3.11]